MTFNCVCADILVKITYSMSVCSHCQAALPPENDFVTCGSCKGVLHYGCAGVRETTWRKYSAENKQAWKCAICRVKNVVTDKATLPEVNKQCGQTTADGVDCISETSEIGYLKQLLIHKDLVIASQTDLINSLKAQIQLMQVNNNMQKSESSTSTIMRHMVQGPPPPTQSTKRKSGGLIQDAPTSSVISQIKTSENTKERQLAAKAVNYEVQEALTRAKLNDVINLASNVDEWKVAKPKRYRTKQMIVGDRAEDGKCSLRASETLGYWHVYRLHPSTTAGEVEDYLKVEFPDVKVEKLNSANPTEYSSFKITIRELDEPKIVNAGLWPSGTRVRRFFLSRNR